MLVPNLVATRAESLMSTVNPPVLPDMPIKPTNHANAWRSIRIAVNAGNRSPAALASTFVSNMPSTCTAATAGTHAGIPAVEPAPTKDSPNAFCYDECTDAGYRACQQDLCVRTQIPQGTPPDRNRKRQPKGDPDSSELSIFAFHRKPLPVARMVTVTGGEPARIHRTCLSPS